MAGLDPDRVFLGAARNTPWPSSPPQRPTHPHVPRPSRAPSRPHPIHQAERYDEMVEHEGRRDHERPLARGAQPARSPTRTSSARASPASSARSRPRRRRRTCQRRPSPTTRARSRLSSRRCARTSRAARQADRQGAQAEASVFYLKIKATTTATSPSSPSATRRANTPTTRRSRTRRRRPPRSRWRRRTRSARPRAQLLRPLHEVQGKNQDACDSPAAAFDAIVISTRSTRSARTRRSSRSCCATT